MPVLKEYSDSYKKDGYYVHAPIQGLDHPLPLQTPDITAKIYRAIGYSAGDHVPNELTWKLYKVNLHWTGNSGPDEPPEDTLKESIRTDTGPRFSKENAQTILGVIESYSGSYEAELASLAGELDVSEPTQPSYSSGMGTEMDHDDWVLELLGEDEPISTFRKNYPESVSEDRLETIKKIATPNKIDEIDGDTFSDAGPFSSKEEYYRQLADCPQVARRLTLFDTCCPLEIRRTVPLPPSIGIFYDVFTSGIDNGIYEDLTHFIVSDHRFDNEQENDWIITVSITGIIINFEITDTHISDFTVHTPQESLGRFNEEAIDTISSGDNTPEQYLHHGLGTLARSLTIIDDFFDNFPNYTLCSVGPFVSKNE